MCPLVEESLIWIICFRLKKKYSGRRSSQSPLCIIQVSVAAAHFVIMPVPTMFICRARIRIKDMSVSNSVVNYAELRSDPHVCTQESAAARRRN